MALHFLRCSAAKSDTIAALRTCRRPGGGSGTRAYDPKRASSGDKGCMGGFMQPEEAWIVLLAPVRLLGNGLFGDSAGGRLPRLDAPGF